MTINRRFVLHSRPNGRPSVDDFRMVETSVAPLGDGEFLVRHQLIGLAPAARIRIGTHRAYAPPVDLGETVYAQTAGTVVESRDPAVPVGTGIVSDGGWQEYSVGTAASTRRIDMSRITLVEALGVLGSSGLTAHVGMVDIGRPAEGETIVVSAASGAVGSIAGQIARILGARVVGIAGGAEKCAYVVDELGFDTCVDYRAPDFGTALAAACPDGVDVYFENVGGKVGAAVWELLNNFARIPVCGLVSEYGDAKLANGPSLFSALVKRLTITGFLLRDHLDRRDEMLATLEGWLRDGRIRYREHFVDGFETLPAAFGDLLDGSKLGKLIVRL